MNVITVSREYGAGGGEIASHLAEALGWEPAERTLQRWFRRAGLKPRGRSDRRGVRTE